MLNAETITDSAKKSTSREERFVRPLIEAALRLIRDKEKMKKLDIGLFGITYCQDSLIFGSPHCDVHKWYAIKIQSQGKTVLDVHYCDEPDEEPRIRLFRAGNWEEQILSASLH